LQIEDFRLQIDFRFDDQSEIAREAAALIPYSIS